jgi:hypothetical protein
MRQHKDRRVIWRLNLPTNLSLLRSMVRQEEDVCTTSVKV